MVYFSPQETSSVNQMLDVGQPPSWLCDLWRLTDIGAG